MSFWREVSFWTAILNLGVMAVNFWLIASNVKLRRALAFSLNHMRDTQARLDAAIGNVTAARPYGDGGSARH